LFNSLGFFHIVLIVSAKICNQFQLSKFILG
jgi:hypothetical protein